VLSGRSQRGGRPITVRPPTRLDPSVCCHATKAHRDTFALHTRCYMVMDASHTCQHRPQYETPASSRSAQRSQSAPHNAHRRSHACQHRPQYQTPACSADRREGPNRPRTTGALNATASEMDRRTLRGPLYAGEAISARAAGPRGAQSTHL